MKYLVFYTLKTEGEETNSSFTYEYSGEESLSPYDPELLHVASKIAGCSYSGRIIGIHITDIEPLDS